MRPTPARAEPLLTPGVLPRVRDDRDLGYDGQIADERLRGASIAAKAAAIEAVEQSVLAEDEDDEDDILSSGFVQLDIGDQSPMVRDGQSRETETGMG